MRSIIQHLDTTLTLMIAGHRVGHYSAEGKLLTPLTKKQINAVEKTLPPPLLRLMINNPDTSLATKSGHFHFHLLTTLPGRRMTGRRRYGKNAGVATIAGRTGA